jgi:large repetitive protein
MHSHRRGALAAIVAIAFTVSPAVAGATTIHVTSTADSVAGCTLRNAITAANSNITAGTCPAGQAAPTVDTIDFAGVGGPAITLTSGLPQVTESVSVAGPGASQLAIDGADNFQPFKISAPAVTISGLTIRNGLCNASCGSQGGAILVSPGAVLTLDSGSISSSTAASATIGNSGNFAEGGAIEVNAAATLHVISSDLTGNTVTASGATVQNGASAGAIMNRGTVTIDRSTLAGNVATATAGAGSTGNVNAGAVDSDGHLTITRSTLSGNQVSSSGPGASSTAGGAITEFNDPANVSLTVDRSTIANNTVAGTGSGGGIYSIGTIGTVMSSTITGNSASFGANLALAQPLVLSNSIVADPQVGANCSASTISSQGYNLESTDTCGLGQPTDIKNVSPMLGALADNGGPTQTRAPMAGSPVVDKGKAASGEVLDQRGLLRPSDIDSITNAAGGDGGDIGAVEVQDTLAPDTTITAGLADGVATKLEPTYAFSSSEAVSSFECSIDAAAFTACSSPDVLTGIADGIHTFAVRAVDGTGNGDASPASRTFTLDTVAPRTTIGKLKKKTTKRKVKVKFSSSENGSTFECRLDSKPFKPCDSPYKAKKPKPGKHVIQVRATDSAGNTESKPASKKIKVLRKR